MNPRRDDDDIEAQNQSRDFARYREYLHGQVRELLTNYGQIDYLFFDFSYPQLVHPSGIPGKARADWDSETLMAMVRELGLRPGQPRVQVG